MTGSAKKKKLWLRLVLAAIIIGIVLLVVTESVDWPKVREWMQHLDHRLLLVLMAVRPLFGFSISLIYLVIGAVFGGPVGGVGVTGLVVRRSRVGRADDGADSRTPVFRP